MTTDLAYALDTFGLLMCALLVMLMQPGFALLEAGLHSAKNLVNILMKNFADFAVAGLAFWAFGFALMYGGGPFLAGYEPALNAPVAMELLFQLVFAATAATIVSGAIGGRAKFSGYLIFSVVLTATVYPMLGRWHWGGGWLSELGFHDFAGSSVVHAVGGFAALGAVLALGPRLGRYVGGKSVALPGHNMALAGIGVFLLWIAWFGFNGGSQLSFSTTEDAVAIAGIALSTYLASAAGAVAALLASWALFAKPDFSMTINGALAGLVAITAGPDVIAGGGAVAVGALGGLLVIGSVLLLDRLRIDDPVGAVSVHGVVGVWGTLAVGLFGGANLGVQLLGTLCYALGAFMAGFVGFRVLHLLGLARVSANDEVAGLDVSEHGTIGYSTTDLLNQPVVMSSGD